MEIEQPIKEIPELVIGDTQPKPWYMKVKDFFAGSSISLDGSFFINTNWKIGKGKD